MAQLKVLAGGSLANVLADLKAAFERDTPHRLDIFLAPTPELIKAATSGEAFDLGVTPIDVMQDAQARARFSGEPVRVARSVFGVAVKAGVPKPDIGTPAAFKAAMLKATSVAVLPDSAAGTYITKLFERLGIAAEMDAKSLKQSGPAGIVTAVAEGRAELGIFLSNVLTAPGLELADPFPDGLQHELAFTAAISIAPKEPAAAKAFIDYLQTPASRAAFEAKGLKAG
jgi:molybdate transport system substrate-binding protein